MKLVWSWYGVSMELVWSWYGVGMELVWSWYRVGIVLVSSWYRVGMELVWHFSCTVPVPTLNTCENSTTEIFNLRKF